MLLLSLLIPLTSAGEPTLALSWRGEHAQLTLVPPAGEHVNLEAPADLGASWNDQEVTLRGTGASLASGLDLHGATLATVHARGSVSLCTDGGTICRAVAVEGQATLPDAKKGTLTLEPVVAEAHSSPFRADAQAAWERAVEEAGDTGRKLLLDFSAVWCPPCNLMSAEVLHAQPRPPELEDYVVVVLDVDDPSSWPLKDRYGVGSYPTVVLTEADGSEIARNIGYDSADTFKDWLLDSATAEPTVGDAAAIDPSSVSPEQAADIAWRLIQRDQGDPTAWIERAAAAPESASLHLARVIHAPNVEDIQWLASHAPDKGLQWVFPASELVKTQPEAKVPLLYAVRRALQSASGPQAADLLYLAASLSEDDEGPLLYAAAAAALRASLTGDPALDRGYWTWLAELEAHSGDVPGALRRLEEATRAFPDEPTFLLAQSSLLLDADRPEEALAAADQALPLAWGDNLLRVALARVDALQALHREEEAKAFATEILANTPEPDAELKVRAHRYRKQLREHAKLVPVAE